MGKPQGDSETGSQADADSKEPLQLELDIEVTLKRDPSSKSSKDDDLKATKFVDDIGKVKGVTSAILVTFNGGYMS